MFDQILFFIGFPLFFEFFLKLITGVAELSSVWAPFLTIVGLFCPFVIFRKRISFLKNLYIILLYIPCFINIGHIIFFNSEISNCSFITMFESNFQEIKEFFYHFFSMKFLILTCCFWSFCILFYIKSSRIGILFNKKIAVLMFFVLYSAFCFGDQRYKFPFEKILFTYIEHELDSIKNMNIIRNRGDFKFSDIRSSLDGAQTYIVIIGESVNKHHMSLYGAKEKTTPYLDSMESDLFIFRNVKSAHCNTREAVAGLLCLNENFEDGDIITFFKQAGFKTFWFSNQYTAGNCDNFISMIASLSDEKAFINKSHYRTKLTSVFDEKLLDNFKGAFYNKADRKIIFLHLMGSHLPYCKRYPAAFDKFKSYSNFSSKLKEIDEYHNSILYTDYILNKILEIVKQYKGKVCVLYFSDHGEDITESPTSPHSHVESLSTPAMFEIPFIVWLSDEYKNSNEEFIKNWDLNREYITDNLIHSLINLARLHSKEYDYRKSIFEKKS